MINGVRPCELYHRGFTVLDSALIPRRQNERLARMSAVILLRFDQHFVDRMDESIGSADVRSVDVNIVDQ